jgi:hypothetical protein
MKTFCLAIALSLSILDGAVAQQIESICLALAKEGFVDTRNASFVSSSYAETFREVCAVETEMVSRFKNSSASFQGAFKGWGMKGSGGGTKGFGESKDTIKAACDRGHDKFIDYVATEEKTTTGRYLAASIVDCARVLATSKIEAVFGSVRVDEDDKGFNVDARYVPGETALTYTLTRITGRATCYASQDKKDPIAGKIVMVPNSSSAFYCEKPHGEGVLGSFVFEASVDGRQKPSSVPYEANSRVIELENAKAVEAKVAKVVEDFTSELATLKEANDNAAKALQGRIDVLGNRKIVCNSYGTGLGYGDVKAPSQTSFCKTTSEVAVSCSFGSNQSSHDIITQSGVQGCRNQNPAGPNWAIVRCCSLQ